MPASFPSLQLLFPRLTPNNYDDTSLPDPSYNCIGHAADTTQWWEPRPVLGGRVFWPAGVPLSRTFQAYEMAYATIGYQRAADEYYVAGREKIALFELNGECSHAAKQLDAIYWTSKLGKYVDIKHHLRALEGPTYGAVAIFLQR